MRRCEVLVPGASLVDFDNYETGGEGRDTPDVEEEVCKRAGALLFGSVGRLQHEGGLDGEEKASRVEELRDEVSVDQRLET